MKSLELPQIVLQLLQRLVRSHRWIKRLIGHSPRDEIVRFGRVPEVPVADLQKTAVGERAGHAAHPQQRKKLPSRTSSHRNNTSRDLFRYYDQVSADLAKLSILFDPGAP